MKKIFITFLILGVASGAFAQLTRQLTVDINPNALITTAPFGDAADKEHDNYAGDGTFTLLTPYNGNMGKTNDVRLAFTYTAPSQNYGAHIRLNFDYFVRNSASEFVNRGGAWENIENIFKNVTIDEYRVWGTVNRFTGWVGNTADRGTTSAARFDVIEDFGINPVKVGNFGVHTPVRSPSSSSPFLPSASGKQIPIIGITDSDTNNFGRSNNETGAYGRADTPYFLFTTNFAPFSVQLGGDIGNNAFANTFIPKPNSHIAVNGGIRISGDRIANLISFDAIYKFRGGDIDTDDNASVQPDAKGLVAHNFGVYANLHLLPILGIGVGYTGLVRAYEKMDIGDTTYDRVGPYFNGIDIRFQFTGINRLRLTMHNNISFAVVNGADPNNKMVYGVYGNSFAANGAGNIVDNTPTLGLDQSESWFGLYNAIGVNFRMTDALSLNADFGNRLGIITNTLNGDKDESLVNSFAAALWAGYSVNNNVLLQGGVRFMVNSYTEKYRDPDLNDLSGGTFTFAVPLRVRIIY